MDYVKLTRQPLFPYEDLTPTNASRFAEGIQDADILKRHSDLATTQRPYALALQTIRTAAFEHIPEQYQADIQKGMDIYEVASWLVAPESRHPYLTQGAFGACVPLLEHELKTNFDGTMEIKRNFETAMSFTTIAIQAISMKLRNDPVDWDAPTDYFVAGAALAHRLEADARRT